MKILEKIENIIHYEIFHSNIYCRKGNEIFLNGLSIKKLDPNFFGEFYINNGDLIIQSFLGQFEYNGNFYSGYYNYLNHKSLSYLNKNDNNIYIIKDGVEVALDLNKNFYEMDNNALILNSNSLTFYSFSEATYKWQYDLAELGQYTPIRDTQQKPYEVVKFIGTWQNQLLVACSDGLILCLDIHTGKEIRRFHNCPEYRLGSITLQKFHDANSFVLDAENETLFALNTYFYMEIDLKSGQIKIDDLANNLKEKNISFLRQSRDYAWDKEYIYTIGDVANHNSPKAIGDKCLCAYNRKTQKIDWQHIFENDSINTDIPQLSGNKLYQLSANKTLHIFEKESKPESHEG